MENKDKTITFLIAEREKQQGFFETFNLASNFKKNANVVVLEDTNALELVLENFSVGTKFRLLIHADIGVDGTVERTQKLKTAVKAVQAISGCAHINPFFVTRSGVIEKLCMEQKKYFIQINDKDTKEEDVKIMCTNTTIMAEIEFLNNFPPFSKGMPTSDTNNSQKPKIFIGSSVQGLKIARAIRASLKHDATVHLWDDNGCFNANEAVLDGLEKIVNNHDYGIFIFRPDDRIYNIKRGDTTVEIPRDNVIFEYGMFMGKHTRKKVFFVVPDPQKDFKIMSDLSGIMPLKYKVDKVTEAEVATDGDQKKLLYSEAVSDACDSIKTDISV